VISCTLDNCFLGKVDRYGRTLSLFNIPGICNPRVMTCRKGPNGNEMNVAFILLPACWNTIMSSIAPLAHPMTKARKGTTISKISRNGIVYRDGYLCARCTNDRLCCIFCDGSSLRGIHRREWNCRSNFGRIGYQIYQEYNVSFVPSFPANTTKSEFVKWFQGLGE
jgi:hypothetical protein